MPAIEARANVDPGVLANNGMQVRMLQQALSQSAGLAKEVPDAIRLLIEDEAWREFMTIEGRVFKWSPADFRRFLEAPRPAGCQTKVETVAKLLEQGTDAWKAFHGLIRGTPGGANNPFGRAGKPEPEINHDDIRVDSAPATIPFDAPHAVKADRSNDAPCGTSTNYVMRRLNRQAPELAEAVCRGEMSAHAAGVKAGFVEKKITVPADPARAAKILSRHFAPDDLRRLVAEIQALNP